MITKEYIEYKISINKLTVCVHSPDGYRIKSYQLALDNKICNRKELSGNAVEFVLNKSGTYQIRITYYNNCGDYLLVDSDKFNVLLVDVSPEQIKNLIKINYRNNKISIDCSDAEHLYFQVTNYMLEKQGIVFYSGESPVIPICESGCHNVSITYTTFNNKTEVINFEVFVEFRELSQDVIDVGYSDNHVQKYLVLNILFAFIQREFQRKYDKGYLRYFSIILGPAVQLIILVTIFTIMGRKSVAGLGIPLFVLTGILPYTFFTSAGNCLTIVSGNRSLLSYRQVKIIDIILSSILMELLVNIIVFLGGIVICWYFSINIIIYNPLSLVFAFLLLFIFTLGLSMILAVIGFYFAEFNYAIQVVFRALFYISGVFFSIENIPVQYQKYVLWNPLLQIIEFIRFSFVSFNLPYELSYLYLFKCTLVILLLGLAMYFVNRNKFMVNDRAR